MDTPVPPSGSVGYVSTVSDGPSNGVQLSALLLGLGVALLVVAATIFAAVTWNSLGALGQGALLIGLTAVAGAATRFAAQRRLTGTAEALGVLTVVLGPLVAQAVRLTLSVSEVDDRSWGNWSAWSWWPAAVLAIGLLASGFGRWVGVRSPRYLGAVLVQLALPLWVLLAPVSPGVLALVLVAQAAVVAVGPAFTAATGAPRTIWAGGAVTTWVSGALVALATALAAENGSSAHVLGAVALAGTAVTAGVIAWRWYRQPGVGELATAACTFAGLATVARVLGGVVADVAWWPMVGLAAVGGLVVASRLDGPHRSAARASSWVVAAMAAAPVAFAGGVAYEAMVSFDAAWHGDAGAPVELWVRRGFVDPLWLSAVAGLAVVVAAAVVDVGLRSRRTLPAISTVSAVAIMVLVPPLLELPLGAVVGLALSVAAVLAAVAWRSARPRVEFTAAGAAVAIAGLWSVGPVSLELAAIASVGGLAALALVRGLRAADSALAGIGAAAAAAAVVAESGRAIEAVTGDAAWSVAVAAMAAALAGVVMALAAPVQAAVMARPRVDGRPPPPGAAPGTMSTATTPAPAPWVAVMAASTVLLGAHLLALVSIHPAADGESAAPLTLALVIGAVSAGAVAGALRAKSTMWIGWAALAAAEVLTLTWLRLGNAGVATPEAYTLPVAAVLAVGGWAICRERRGGWRKAASWHLEGPALAMALGPTVLVALGDPGVLRQVIGLAVGAALLATGVGGRRRAPVDIGGVAVGLLGLQGLAPYAAEVPRWISFGLVGAVLVALGATFEQRRQDLRQARRHYTGLR